MKTSRERPIIHRGVRHEQRVLTFMSLAERGHALSPEQVLVLVDALKDAKRELRDLRERERATLT